MNKIDRKTILYFSCCIKICACYESLQTEGGEWDNVVSHGSLLSSCPDAWLKNDIASV